MDKLIEKVVNIWPDNTSDKKKYIDEVWQIITNAYAKIGGCNCEKEELFEDNIYWKFIRRDGKITAVCLYKITPYGRKLFLLGSDGTEQGKKDIRQIMQEDISQEERNFYAEVSETPEYMYLKRGAKPVSTKDAQMILGDEKIITPTKEDEYHYTRKIGPQKNIYRKIMLGNPKLEGISKDDDDDIFDEDSDSVDDIISLTGTKLYDSTIGDNIYWFGYKFNDNVSRKDRKDFADWIKGLAETKPTQQQYEQIISRPINQLYIDNGVEDIGLIVSPRSNRSDLVQRMLRVIGNLFPHSIRRSSVELVKNANKNVEFDWDLFNEEFTGDSKQYQDIKSYIESELLPKIHSGEYFSIARDVKPKYRPYIKDYLIADSMTKNKILDVGNGSILIVDDINTTSSTINEILKVIKSINPNCTIYIFTLIGKE